MSSQILAHPYDRQLIPIVIVFQKPWLMIEIHASLRSLI